MRKDDDFAWDTDKRKEWLGSIHEASLKCDDTTNAHTINDNVVYEIQFNAKLIVQHTGFAAIKQTPKNCASNNLYTVQYPV
jgi:hypothetical protein